MKATLVPPLLLTKELPLFLLLASVKFLVVFGLVLTRDLKDTLIVTHCGAEAISVLKFCGVLPTSAVFFYVYSRASDHLRGVKLWLATAIPFYLYFLTFGLLMGDGAAEFGRSTEGGTAACLINFSHLSLFYVISEVYSTVSIGILFWQFANDSVSLEQSKSFYPLFGQISSLAPVFAGEYCRRVAAIEGLTLKDSIQRVCFATTLSGVGMIACRLIHCIAFPAQHLIWSPPKSKKRPSLRESIQLLASSPELGRIAILVVSYGVAIQLSDVMWKSIMKEFMQDPVEYQRYTATLTSRVGITTFLAVLIGRRVIGTMGWTMGALTTPLLLGCFGIPFFLLVSLYVHGWHSLAPLHMLVQIGYILTLVVKASKIALFDPTTQMAYIPLNQELKVKGKAAIDVLGSRVGKSSGALLQQFVIMLSGSVLNGSQTLFLVFSLVMILWTRAVLDLSSFCSSLNQRVSKDL